MGRERLCGEPGERVRTPVPTSLLYHLEKEKNSKMIYPVNVNMKILILGTHFNDIMSQVEEYMKCTDT